jgi:hypothetical protein
MLFDIVRPLIVDCYIPTPFWGDAIHAACQIRNRLPSESTNHISLHQLWFGNATTFKAFHRFGCVTYAHTLSIPKGAKVDSHAIRCCFWVTSIYRRGFSCFGTSSLDTRYNPEMSDSSRGNPQHATSSLTFQIALHSSSFLLPTMRKSIWNPFPSTMRHMRIHLTTWTSTKHSRWLQSLTICALVNLDRNRAPRAIRTLHLTLHLMSTRTSTASRRMDIDTPYTRIRCKGGEYTLSG